MPVQQARARNRQQRILSAAAAVIARRGYGDAAVDEIAREAGTSKGGVYFHFPGKEAILLALLDHTATLLRGKVEKAIAAQTEPMDKAEAALMELLRVLGKHRTLAHVFAVEALGAGPRFQQRVAAIQDEFAGMIRVHLDEAVRTGVVPPIDTATAADAWVGMLFHVILRRLTSRDRRNLDETYATLRLLVLRSVGADTAASDQRTGGLRRGH